MTWTSDHKNQRKKIGLWPMRLSHILNFSQADYYPSSDDIIYMDFERRQAVREYLDKELKWRNNDINFTTKWSAAQNIMWVNFQDEHVV